MVVGEAGVDVARPVDRHPREDVAVGAAGGRIENLGVVPGDAEDEGDGHVRALPAVDDESVVDVALAVDARGHRGGAERHRPRVHDHVAGLRERRLQHGRVGVDRRRRPEHQRLSLDRLGAYDELLVAGIGGAIGQVDDVLAVGGAPIAVVERRRVGDRRGQEGLAVVERDAGVDVHQRVGAVERGGVEVVEAVRVPGRAGLDVAVAPAVGQVGDTEERVLVAARVGDPPQAHAVTVRGHVADAVGVEADRRLLVPPVVAPVLIRARQVQVAAEDVRARGVVRGMVDGGRTGQAPQPDRAREAVAGDGEGHDAHDVPGRARQDGERGDLGVCRAGRLGEDGVPGRVVDPEVEVRARVRPLRLEDQAVVGVQGVVRVGDVGDREQEAVAGVVGAHRRERHAAGATRGRRRVGGHIGAAGIGEAGRER